MGEIADTDDEDEGDGGAAGGNTAAQERALQGASMDVDAGGEGGAEAMAGGTLSPPPPCHTPCYKLCSPLPCTLLLCATQSRSLCSVGRLSNPCLSHAPSWLRLARLRTHAGTTLPTMLTSVCTRLHSSTCPVSSCVGDDGGLKVQEIDAYWLQRRISGSMPGLEAAAAQRLAADVYEALRGDDDAAAEGRVVQLLGLDHFDLAKELLANRHKIVWVVRLRQAQDDAEVRAALVLPGQHTLLCDFVCLL